MASVGFEFDTVDVFTTTRFGGNPLAVIKIPQGKSLSQAEKQQIAREFNYSETVFLHAAETPNQWRLDIFMTTCELPLAGHPIVGATWMLGQDPNFRQGTLLCKAGPVDIEVTRDSGTLLAFASIPHNVHIHKQSMGTKDILAVQPGLQSTLENSNETFPVVSIVKGMTFVLVRLATEDQLESTATTGKAVAPSLDADWESAFTGGYYYTLKRLGRKFTLHVRMIEALLEDPATGSAACCVAAYLSLEAAAAAAREPCEGGGEYEFDITQGVTMGRKSVIKVLVRMTAEGKVDKVQLGGSATHVMRGTFC